MASDRHAHAPAAVAAALMALAVLQGCATTRGDGSESHFVTCKTDVDCAGVEGAPHCGDQRCGPVPTQDAAVSDADGAPAVPHEAGGPPDAMDPACDVPGGHVPGPHAVTFRFTNASGKDLSIWQSCTLAYTLGACETAYERSIAFANICDAICPETVAPLCGACMDEPALVTSAAPVTDTWAGYSFVRNEAGSCTERVALPAGRYRIGVPVYPGHPPRPNGVWERVPLYTVTAEFTTGQIANVVEIPIDVPPADAGR